MESERGIEVKPDVGQVQISDMVSANGMALQVPNGFQFNHAKNALEIFWKTKDLSQLYIGDLLNQVEDQEYYSQLLDEVQYTERSIIRYKRVAREVAPDDRWPNLSFDHLESVCPLMPDVQNSWLQAASEGHWTTARLRKELRDAGLITAQPRKKKVEVVECQQCGKPIVAIEDEGCPWCQLKVTGETVEALRGLLNDIRYGEQAPPPAGWIIEICDLALEV